MKVPSIVILIETAYIWVCFIKFSWTSGQPFIIISSPSLCSTDSEPKLITMLQAVPLFHFYKDGVLLESFPTRDKERIIAAILKYTSPASQDV